MKKKCMAVGGTAKKPATMEEQLAEIRGKVRPGYQAGGIAGQVDDFMSRTKAMPGSIASAPQPYGGSVIPAQTGQQAMQAAANFGAANAVAAPTVNSQTISTGDYSTGPRQGGFVDEYGRPIQENVEQQEQQQGPAPLLSMAEKEAALGLNPNRAYKPGSVMDPLASGGGISQALKVADATGVFRKPAADINQLAQLDVPRRRGRQRPDFANGGIIDKFIRTVGKILPDSSGEKYEPGIQSRAAEDPARHGRAEALSPRTQTASSETPPAGGFQEEAERRRKQMKEAMNYEAGGMVRFAGKGGPRDDQIPVKVAGQEINVSNGENAVILPAKTAANPAALYAIGGIIQATNDGRKPKMGMEKSDYYARGGIVGGNLSSSGSYVNEDDISGVENLKRAMATYAKPFQAVGQVFADSARAQQEGVSYQDILAQNQDPVRAKHNAILAGQGTSGAVDLPITKQDKQAAIANTEAARQGIAAGIAQPSGAVVNDGMTTTQMGRGFDPTKLQMAPGYGMASNAAGKTISVGPSEYVGADGKPTSRWTDTQQYKDAIARNQADKLRLAEMQSRRLGADPMAVQKASQGIAGGVLDARTQEAVLQRNAQIQSLVAKAAAEPDQGKRQQFIDAALAMQGKDNKQEKNLQVVDLGSESAPDGMGGVKAIPRGQALYDASTKQWVPMASGSAPQGDITGTAEANKIKADYQAKKITKEQANAALAKLEGR